MELREEIIRLQKRAVDVKDNIETEEATKNALVMPMLRALGYDVFNPLEVVPEFTADIGTKKGEKVDYAILNEGVLSILIECKKVGVTLNSNHTSQLYRYFGPTAARFGILTDGIIYEFYSDLDEQNKMDKKPFFIFDLFSHSETDLKELKKFSKSKYEEDSILSAANNLKYARLIDAVLTEEFDDPSEEMIKLLGNRVHDGRMTANVMSWMSVLVKDAFQRAIRSRVRANLESALGKDDTPEPIQEPIEDPGVDESLSDIVTTSQEIDAFNIIRAILSEVTDPTLIHMRDSKSYCAILFDDNNRKPICRLYLDGKQWRVGTFSSKSETRHDIMNTSDIFKLSKELKATVYEYAPEASAG